MIPVTLNCAACGREDGAVIDAATIRGAVPCAGCGAGIDIAHAYGHATWCRTCGEDLSDCECALTAGDLEHLLEESGVTDWTEHDLGWSGGGDWWAVRVPADRGRFILITPVWGPWDFNDPDETASDLAVVLYAHEGAQPDGGTDLGESPWVSVSDDVPVALVLDAIAALRDASIGWDGVSNLEIGGV